MQISKQHPEETPCTCKYHGKSCLHHLCGKRFDGFCDGKREIHGDKFDASDLASTVVPHYNAGDKRRIKVRWSDGTEQWGCVGVTTGWKPVFLLMANRRARGSSYLLTPGTFHIVDSKDMKR